MGRNPPTGVARKLRQEAGFGCAICGCPIIEYHHIIEWNERQHFEPEHMVALCPTHHSEFGKLPTRRAYAAKQNPFNIRHGKFEGYLGGKVAKKGLRFGGMTLVNCKNAVEYSGIKMLAIKSVEDETLLDFFFPKDDFWPEIEILENQANAYIKPFWDIEFKTNWIKFKRSDKSFLEIDFRGDFIEIMGSFKLHDVKYELRTDSFGVDSNTFVNCEFLNSNVGISLGSPRRILRPNYAMAEPRARFAD